jgi:TonB family protein
MKPHHAWLSWFPRNLMRVVFVCFVLCVLSAKLFAQSAIAITASGKMVPVAPGQKPPWVGDLIVTVPIEYPYRDRIRNNQAKGMFRVTLDPKTGWVTDVTVRKSIGYTTLDDAAISALRQFRVKPGKWRQFDFLVRFEMARSREEAMEKMRCRQARRTAVRIDSNRVLFSGLLSCSQRPTRRKGGNSWRGTCVNRCRRIGGCTLPDPAW